MRASDRGPDPVVDALRLAEHVGSGGGSAIPQTEHFRLAAGTAHSVAHPAWDQPQRGAVAGHHCIACQCVRIFRPSSSGVVPVRNSPALLIADQVPSSALKP